jgi:hypothetical protein
MALGVPAVDGVVRGRKDGLDHSARTGELWAGHLACDEDGVGHAHGGAAQDGDSVTELGRRDQKIVRTCEVAAAAAPTVSRAGFCGGTARGRVIAGAQL